MLNDDQKAIEALIARAGLGDRAAFSDLYDATSPKLLGVCLRILKERAAAEDAMQDAFVKIWKNADRYQASGHSPMTWLITIARNTAIDHLRRRKPQQDIADYEDQIASTGASPEQAVIASSDAARIVSCMDTLDPDRRAAVTGAYLDGKSYKELSGQFDVPLNTMRTWLRRGLEALRECMSK